MKKLLLSLLGALVSVSSLAQDFEYTYEGQTLTYTVIDEEAKTVSTKEGTAYVDWYIEKHYAGNSVIGDLILPQTVINEEKEYTLTEISLWAFSNCSGLTSITIPNTVTEIGYCAFENCSSLISITIPNSVTKIKEQAFLGCNGLMSVAIPNSVTEIGNYVFTRCSSLNEITVEGENKYFASENGVLLNKDRSQLIAYPGGRTGEYSIPNSVTEINEEAFAYCGGLTSLIIPTSVTEIGQWAFQGCSGLASIAIPNSVTEIGNYAFVSCSGLTSITIPNSVTKIGIGAFNNSGLISVTIPGSVTEIGDFAFAYCYGLTSVTIPNLITQIGTRVFKGCSGLTSVTYLAEEPLQGSNDIFDNEVYENATLNYLSTADEKIASTEPWSLFKNRVGHEGESAISEIQNPESGVTAVYDLRGIRIGTSTEELPHGVYIIKSTGKTTKITK